MKLITILLLFGAVGGFSISPSSQEDVEFYVTSTPPPNPDCPKDKPCHTLNEYALNSQSYFGNESKVSLLFLQGTHSLASKSLQLEDKIEVKLIPLIFNDPVTIRVVSTNNIHFKNISELLLGDLTFTSDYVYNGLVEISNVECFNVTRSSVNLGNFTVSNVGIVNLVESDYSNTFLSINFANQTLGSLNEIDVVKITKCKMSDTSIHIQTRTVDVVLKESTIAPTTLFGQRNGLVVSILNKSQVELNVTDCEIASNKRGLSVNVQQSTLSAHILNTKVFDNIVHGFLMDIKMKSRFNILLEESMLSQNLDGVVIETDQSEGDVTIRECSVISHYRNGLLITVRATLANLMITKCNISNNPRAGIEIDFLDESNVTAIIASSTMFNCGYGIQLAVDNLQILESQNNVHIHNCSLSRNLAVALLLFSKSFTYLTPHIETTGMGIFNILIENSCFTKNKNQGVVVSKQNFLQMNTTLRNCTFSQNTGYSLEIDAKASDNIILIENCLFEQNFGLNLIQIQNTHNFNTSVTIRDTWIVNNQVTSQELPTIHLTGKITIKLEDCSFTNNTGSPIELTFGTLIISGNNTFADNLGFKGGALSLINSRLHLANNTLITFQNNSALDVGGAVYVQQEALPLLPAQCFYQVPTTDDVDSLNILLHFKNNKAGRGGNHIYGAALHDNCDIQTTNSGVPSRSVDHFEEFFHFEQSSSNLSLVSSDPQRVCLCESTGQPACANLSYILIQNESRYPGEKFNLSTVVVGDEFGTLSSTVYANFLQTEAEDHVGLNSLQDSQTVDYQQCSTLTYSVHSRGNLSVVLVLKINQAKTNTYGDRYMLKQSLDDYHQSSVIPSILLTTPIFINITLLVCPLGFEISSDPPSCDCNSFLRANNVHNCSIQTHEGSIVRSGTQWLGTLSLDNHTEVILTQYCKFGYCKSETLSINFDNSDKQCSNGRSGVLCGACMNNLSQILGSSECRHCTDNSYLALLIVFAISGFVLVLFIKLLDFTVAKGTINGLIFYANIVWVNQNIILSTERNSTVIGQILKVFLAWLNLDFGINTCFFVGLNAYWKTWLQFVFPIYIWVIAGFIIIISHYSIKASRLFGNNSIPMLATLLLLSYSKLLQTIITVLSPTHLQYSDGYLTVWTEDGTIPYLSSVHAALFSVALFCLVFLWAPFMITLLFIQPLKRFDHLKPLRWINKWKPLFDAYTGPLKDKYFYWIGMLLLARGIILVTSTITSAMIPRVNLLVMAIITAILGLHTNVYKKWYLSLLDKSFLLNLSLLACGLLYIDIVQDTESRLAIAYTSVGIAFLQFICIVCVHVVSQLKNCRQQKRVMPNRQDYREIEAPARNHEGEDYREPLIESSRLSTY